MERISRVIIGGLGVITVILALVPIFQTLSKGDYQGVIPAYVDDDLYYYSRIKEVADGKPFIGNPYFIEHRNAGAAAFFVTDWIASIPFLFALSFSSAVILNFIFWSLVSVYLIYRFCRAVGVSSVYSAGVALLVYCEVYWVIFRPVVMQQVFPFFLFFLLAFLFWLRQPLRRRSIGLLALACALPFYIYPFLWQIIFSILGVVFVHRLVQKNWFQVKSLLWVVLGTTGAALPALAYTVHQIQQPLYWETVNRVGLVTTHLPTLDAYFYGRWALVLVILYVCVRAWLKTEDFKKWDSKNYLVDIAVYSGLGLLFATLSNVVTGQDIATASHIGRFITLWVALFFPLVIWVLWMNRAEAWRASWLKCSVIVLLSLACLGFLASNLKRSLPFQRIAKTDVRVIQGYAEPLGWIEGRESEPVVIWTNDDMTIYVPIITKHYVFWSHLGGLHLMSTQEVQDRFLASRTATLTAAELLPYIERIEGAGVGRRYEDVYNKNNLKCLLGMECARDVTLEEWVGEEKITQLLKRQIELKKDMQAILKKYDVSYIVADTSKKEDSYFKLLPGAREVWKNNRFIVYEIR